MIYLDILIGQGRVLYLIIIYLYLILNAIFIAQNQDSIVRAVGFLRFIILSYAIFYYLSFFKKKIIKFWFVIFFIVSVDIVIEYFLGKNSLGFSSDYPGRIASFTGDELKIGHFYFGFIFIALAFLSNKKKKIQIITAILFFILALIIGERSNFLKIFIMYSLFFFVLFRNILLEKIFDLYFFIIINFFNNFEVTCFK